MLHPRSETTVIDLPRESIADFSPPLWKGGDWDWRTDPSAPTAALIDSRAEPAASHELLAPALLVGAGEAWEYIREGSPVRLKDNLHLTHKYGRIRLREELDQAQRLVVADMRAQLGSTGLCMTTSDGQKLWIPTRGSLIHTTVSWDYST
jgi:hypothetical protein